MFLFPLAILVLTSFKYPNDIFHLPVQFLPNKWDFSNYKSVFKEMPFFRYILNTLFLCVVNVVGQLLTSPLVAYSLSKIKWRGRNILFVFILGTMMLPFQVTMIPVYMIWNSLGLVGTYWPLTLGAFFGSAFFIFMLRQFFMNIPDEMLEAAKVDGAGELRIYFQIVLPLARPALTTVGIFTFLWTWTDFLGPLIYLNNPNMYTISVGLESFFSQHGVQWGPLMSASVIFALPMIVLFLFAQRQFIKGMTLTGFK
jgi:multiple sugar transport system permease protein